MNVERRTQEDLTYVSGSLMATPPIEEDYWQYRVRLSEAQAIIGFPKFGTIGIGFASEEDWNLNLPYTCKAEDICGHIVRNKGDDGISTEECVAAIRMIQNAVASDRDA